MVAAAVHTPGQAQLTHMARACMHSHTCTHTTNLHTPSYFSPLPCLALVTDSLVEETQGPPEHPGRLGFLGQDKMGTRSSCALSMIDSSGMWGAEGLAAHRDSDRVTGTASHPLNKDSKPPGSCSAELVPPSLNHSPGDESAGGTRGRTEHISSGPFRRVTRAGLAARSVRWRAVVCLCRCEEKPKPHFGRRVPQRWAVWSRASRGKEGLVSLPRWTGL